MDIKDAERRQFLGNTGKLITAAAVGGVVSSTANAGFKFEMDAATGGQCATCKFWGGVRKIIEDGKTVEAKSLGYCNNPNSPNYQKTTTPETGPMKAWQKWGAIS